MADDAYTNALAKKERLIRELDEVNNFLKLYQRFMPKATAKVEQPASSGLFSDTPVDNSTDRVSVPQKFEPIIRRMLLFSGQPLSRSMLLKALSDNGTPIPGKDASKNLGTILWRLRERFVNIEGHGYWVVGVKMPHLGYDPPGAISFEEALVHLETTP